MPETGGLGQCAVYRGLGKTEGSGVSEWGWYPSAKYVNVPLTFTEWN